MALLFLRTSIALMLVIGPGCALAQTATPDHMSKKVKPIKRNNTTDHMTKKVRRVKRNNTTDHMTRPVRSVKRNNNTDHMTQKVRKVRRDNTTDHMTQQVRNIKRNNTTDHMTQKIGKRKNRKESDAFAVKIKSTKKKGAGADAFAGKYSSKKVGPPKKLDHAALRRSSAARDKNLKGVSGKRTSNVRSTKQRASAAKADRNKQNKRASTRVTSVKDDSAYHQENHFMKGRKSPAPAVGDGWQKRKLFARGGYRQIKQKEKKGKKNDDAFAYSPKKREKDMRRQRNKMELDLFQGPVNPSGRHKGARGRLRVK